MTAKGAGDFLLDFDHPNIALSQIVVKRHIQIVQKRENRILMGTQAIQQIASGMLPGLASFAGSRWGTRMNLISLIQQSQKLRVQSLDIFWQEGGLAKDASVIGHGLHPDQQQDHSVCPPQAHFLRKGGQFSQDMHATQAVLASVEEIGFPGIVHARSSKMSQDSNLIQRIMSSTDMGEIMSQGASARHMQPDALSHHIQPGFVLMDHLGLTQSRFDLVLNRLEEVGGACDQRGHGAFAHVDTRHVSQDFCGSTSWQQLLGRQIDRHGSNPRSILHGSADPGRKNGGGISLTLRALFPVAFILRHLQRGRSRDVNDLPAFNCFGRNLAQVAVRVLRLDDGGHCHDFIGDGAHLKRLTMVTWLSSCLLPAPRAQTVGFALPGKTVRRRGQRTIVTVFRDLLLQSLDLFTQLGDDFLQHRDLLDLFQQQAILLSSLNQFIFHCHALTLLDTTGFGKSLGDLTSY